MSNSHIVSRVGIVASIVLGVALLGVYVAIHLADSQYEREIRNWELRLGITADTRAAAVEQWISNQFDELRHVADNLSVRLYLTQLTSTDEPFDFNEQAADLTYLRSYLYSVADRNGYLASIPDQAVKANIKKSGNAGLIILDKEGQLVVATDHMSELTVELKTFLEQSLAGGNSLKDIFKGQEDVPTIAFQVPVYAVQGEQQVGMILGVKPVTKELYPLLSFPKSTEKTSETLLVRQLNGVVEYLSPLQNGTEPLSLTLNTNTTDFDVGFAIANPSMFGLKKDYASNEVLVTGRTIAGTPWTLIHKIDQNEALAESDARRTSFVSIGVLIVVLLTVLIFAIWRYGISVRTAHQADLYKRLARKFKSQERLLKLVADNQPDAMFILDKHNRYRFANLEAVRYLDMSQDDVIGKRLADVIGPNQAFDYYDLNKAALEEVRIFSRIRTVQREDGQRIYQSRIIPLAKIPGILSEEPTSGVLVVEQDVTTTIRERQRRERILQELVEALVLVIDRRDTHSAYHSKRVAQVAQAIAYEMDLDDVMAETVRIAGTLMNLGKILLPKELLMKKGALTASEKKKVVESIQNSAEFLEGVEFDGPVVETIRHAQEHWDGSGPLGLERDEIIVTARIVAVANAFVAMTSPRSWRPRISEEKVIDTFMDEANKKYQRRVVAALVNYIEKHDGAFDWEDQAA